MIGGIGALIFAAAMAALLFLTNMPPIVAKWITPVWLIALLLGMSGLWYSGRAGGRRAMLAMLMVIVTVGAYVAGVYITGQSITSILQPNPLGVFEEHTNWTAILFACMVVFLLLLALCSLSMVGQILSGGIFWALAGIVMLVWSLAGAASLALMVAGPATGNIEWALLGFKILGYGLFVQIAAWVLAGLAMFSGGRRG